MNMTETRDVRTIQIAGGRIIDPSQGIDQVGDLWLSQGRVLPIGGGGYEEAEIVIDARGLIVCPGLIDCHVHLICPQLVPEALGSGITTFVGGQDLSGDHARPLLRRSGRGR